MSAIPLTDFSKNQYLPYPHCNGFANEGESLILGQLGAADAALVIHDIQTGKQTHLCTFPHGPETDKRLWFEVAEETDQLVAVSQNTIWLYDLKAPDAGRKLYAGPQDGRIHPIPATTSDGTKVTVAVHAEELSRVLQIDVRNGVAQRLFEKPWMADHFHYCRHDENWMGFSHEGACATVPDRVWGWHHTHSPQGMCFFNQHSHNPNRVLFAGHERWCFHETSALVVAYGDSPGTPRGIYEVFVDGRSQRLVSEGNRDWHVNVSHDGQWAVVDTTGPHTLPGKGWENANNRSDVLLLNMKSGERTFLAHSRIGMGHAHPHPVFSPDGHWIFFNEANMEGTLSRVCKIANPFLKA